MSVVSHRIRAALRRHRPGLLQTWSDRDAAERTKMQDRADRLFIQVIAPVLRAVLEHHRPVDEVEATSSVCRGCDTDGELDAEPPRWPCSTWRLIEHRLQHS